MLAGVIDHHHPSLYIILLYESMVQDYMYIYILMQRLNCSNKS